MTYTKASIVSRPQHGKLAQDGDFSFQYSAGSFKGDDHFTLKICGTGKDGSGCSTLNLTITSR